MLQECKKCNSIHGYECPSCGSSNLKPLADPQKQLEQDDELRFSAIDAFTHFLYYAEPDFIEKVWADEPFMAKHFREKLNGLINRIGNGYLMGIEVLVRFNQELTYEYQKKLYTYIIENHSNKWRSNG